MTDVLKTADVAKRLRMSERFVLDEIRRGNLRAAKFGGIWNISEADLRSYIEAHTNVVPTGRTG